MEKRIKYLTISLKIELIIGIFISGFFAMFLATVARDSPTSTFYDSLLAGSLGFIVASLIFIVLPILSIKEIKKYEISKTLKFNYIYAVLFTITSLYLLPLAIWNIYNLVKLRESVLINQYKKE